MNTTNASHQAQSKLSKPKLSNYGTSNPFTRLPQTAGIGFKPEHLDETLAYNKDLLWCEVHPENYFLNHGPRLAALEAIAQRHPLSLHGVGGSLGGAERPDPSHLAKIKALVDRFNPAAVSEHAVWSSNGGHYFADLLPLPRTEQALAQLINGVDAYQNGVGRTILIENPTNYLDFVSEMDEPDFLVAAAQKSGCGLLLDINNLFLSAHNCKMDPHAYIKALPPALVGEIHIAGHVADEHLGDSLLIDSHAHPVAPSVWSLLEFALAHLGPKPVLLERDANLPPFAELIAERDQAQSIILAAKNKQLNGDDAPIQPASARLTPTSLPVEIL